MTLGLVSAIENWDPDEFDGFAQASPEADFDVAGRSAGSDATAAAASSGGRTPMRRSQRLPSQSSSDFMYDEEEFEGFEPKAERAQKRLQSGSRKQGSSLMEYGFIGFCVVFALVYMWGRNENTKIAEAWMNQFRDLFQTQFYQVGLNPGSGAGDEDLLEKESQHLFKLFASGRKNCKGMMAQLELCKRHDLLSYTFGLFSNTSDRLILDVMMDDDSMGPFVFAVVPTKGFVGFQADKLDLKHYAKRVPLEMLPSSMVLLTDCRELIPILLQDKVLKILHKYQDLFVSLHVTDQNTVTRLGTSTVSKKAIQFQLKLPAAKDMARLQKLMEMCIWFVDVVAQQAKLNKTALAKAVDARKRVDRAKSKLEHDRRQERAAQRKQDAGQEKRDRYDSMTASQKKKQDEKEERDKAKKKNKVKTRRM